MCDSAKDSNSVLVEEGNERLLNSLNNTQQQILVRPQY